MATARTLTLRCPDCGSHLKIDAATGEVLLHRKAKRQPAGGRDFDSLLQDLDRERSDAEDVFAREVAAMKDRDRLLDQKFQEALKRAEEEPEDAPPPRPFDLD